MSVPFQCRYRGLGYWYLHPFVKLIYVYGIWLFDVLGTIYVCLNNLSPFSTEKTNKDRQSPFWSDTDIAYISNTSSLNFTYELQIYGLATLQHGYANPKINLSPLLFCFTALWSWEGRFYHIFIIFYHQAVFCWDIAGARRPNLSTTAPRYCSIDTSLSYVTAYQCWASGNTFGT